MHVSLCFDDKLIKIKFIKKHALLPLKRKSQVTLSARVTVGISCYFLKRKGCCCPQLKCPIALAACCAAIASTTSAQKKLHQTFFNVWGLRRLIHKTDSIRLKENLLKRSQNMISTDNI